VKFCTPEKWPGEPEADSKRQTAGHARGLGHMLFPTSQCSLALTLQMGLPPGRQDAAWATVGADDLARGDKQLAVITPTGRLGERDALCGGLAADQPVYRLIVQCVIVMEKRTSIPQGFDEGFLVADLRSAMSSGTIAPSTLRKTTLKKNSPVASSLQSALIRNSGIIWVFMSDALCRCVHRARSPTPFTASKTERTRPAPFKTPREFVPSNPASGVALCLIAPGEEKTCREHLNAMCEAGFQNGSNRISAVRTGRIAGTSMIGRRSRPASAAFAPGLLPRMFHGQRALPIAGLGRSAAPPPSIM
jgi:hypothetical protein